MKKIFTIFLLLLLTLPCFAQVRTVWVKPWQGPKRVFVSGGYQFMIGTPSFKVEGIGNVTPSQFSNYGSPIGSLGIDMVGNEDGFGIGGCFFHFDIYRDGWSSTFNGGETYGPKYAQYTYDYSMSGLGLCGSAGLNMNYTFDEKFQILLGVGLYLNGMTKIKVTSAIHNAAGDDLGEDPISWIYGDSQSSNVTLGLTTHLQLNYFIGEHFFVGLMGRADAWPFYNSLSANDMAHSYYIGNLISAGGDHRRRIQALLTLGVKWD